MKRLIYILPLLFFAQVAFGQVIPQKITVLNAGGIGGGGISKLGNSPYALIKLNDSTYLVDTTLILTKLEGNYLYYPATGNPSSFLQNIAGLIVPGTGMTRTGSGTNGDPYVFNSTGGGSGNGRYIIPEYGIIADSSIANQYKIRVDSATLRDIHYLKKPIYADGDTTKFDYTVTDSLHAQDSIAITTKANNNNTVTINGSSQTLGSNPNFTVGGGGASETGVDSTSTATTTGQTSFTFPYTISYYTTAQIVSRNGILINPAFYTVSSGTITFSFTCDSGDKIRFQGIK